MFKQLEGARLGIFIFFGTVLLVLSIFLVGSKESLFVSTIKIKTYFSSIEGLKTGAPVRLSGYDIGNVSAIELADDNSGRVLIEMNINIDLRHLIRLDSEASIETEGLVGKKLVAISPGSPDLEVIQNGGFIKSKNPLNIAAIIEETTATLSYLKTMTKEFAEISQKINTGEGSLGKLINDDKLYSSAVSITKTAEKSLDSMTTKLSEITDFIVGFGDNLKNIIKNADDAMTDIKEIVKSVDNGEGLVGSLIKDKSMVDSVRAMVNNLALTAKNANVATVKLAENMEALKHNWLFKSYFEERGYWDVLEYEKNIEAKLQEVKTQNLILDKKIKEMLDLEKKLDNR
ncbi:MAG: MlaD family protein [Melioribacteraceae bacterium]